MGVKAWITVNGQHIPIMDGESKASAVGRFIKDKKQKLWSKKYKELQDYDKDVNVKAKHGAADIDVANRYIKSKSPTIKGRAETKEEVEHGSKKAYNEAYNKRKAEMESQRDSYRNMNRTRYTLTDEDIAQSAHTQGRFAARDYKEGALANNRQVGKSYKLSDKYKIENNKRTLKRMETVNEIKQRTLNRIKEAKAAHYQGKAEGYNLYDSGVRKAVNQARKANDAELPKLTRAVKYQGYIAADGANKMKRYTSKALAKETGRRRAIEDVFKSVYGMNTDEFKKKYINKKKK